MRHSGAHWVCRIAGHSPGEQLRKSTGLRSSRRSGGVPDNRTWGRLTAAALKAIGRLGTPSRFSRLPDRDGRGVHNPWLSTGFPETEAMPKLRPMPTLPQTPIAPPSHRRQVLPPTVAGPIRIATHISRPKRLHPPQDGGEAAAALAGEPEQAVADIGVDEPSRAPRGEAVAVDAARTPPGWLGRSRPLAPMTSRGEFNQGRHERECER